MYTRRQTRQGMKTTIKSPRHPDNQIKDVCTVDDVYLPEGLYLRVQAVCRACGCDYDYHGDVDNFDPDMSYCGGSYRCCP